ncbi:hypothetical protein ACJ73_02351 [Blastomyces percursus]|uniref:Uncharacterized protein n=1 Tax=Blastomyces percursus TaxID=1658174 RepID=A0A1J9RCM4_9EURO|nr:hypothetical protein ACJ73_02351 [Blastomyces percursus]
MKDERKHPVFTPTTMGIGLQLCGLATHGRLFSPL